MVNFNYNISRSFNNYFNLTKKASTLFSERRAIENNFLDIVDKELEECFLTKFKVHLGNASYM